MLSDLVASRQMSTSVILWICTCLTKARCFSRPKNAQTAVSLTVTGRRNTRLRKGFVNLERAPFGGLKLRIPSLLFVEKMRTQNRFNVSGIRGTVTSV